VHPVSLLKSIDQALIPDAIELDCVYSFAHGENGTFLLESGWWEPAAWGVWSKHGTASIRFFLPRLAVAGCAALELRCWPIVNVTDHQFLLNGAMIEPRVDTGPGGSMLSIPIPTIGEAQGATVVHLVIQNKRAKSPFELGLNGDRRKLGLGLKSLALREMGRCPEGSLSFPGRERRIDVELPASAYSRCPAIANAPFIGPIIVISNRLDKMKAFFDSDTVNNDEDCIKQIGCSSNSADDGDPPPWEIACLSGCHIHPPCVDGKSGIHGLVAPDLVAVWVNRIGKGNWHPTLGSSTWAQYCPYQKCVAQHTNNRTISR
jgi:hypothetical protein